MQFHATEAAVGSSHQPDAIVKLHGALLPGKTVVAAALAAPCSKALAKVGQQQSMTARLRVRAVLLHLQSFTVIYVMQKLGTVLAEIMRWMALGLGSCMVQITGQWQAGFKRN